MENHFPVEIYNEKDLLDRIRKAKEFRPEFISSVFIGKGKMSVFINGELNEYSENQIIFISNRNIYEADFISDDIELYVVYNNHSFNKSLDLHFNRFEIFKLISVEQNAPLILPVKDFEFIWSLLNGIYHQMKSASQSQYKMDVLFHLQGALIYTIVGHLEASTRSRFFMYNNRKSQITISFIELIFIHFTKEKELKFYANELNISIKYLSICVKETTGNAPTYFLAQLLVEEARVKLSDEIHSISEIAYDLNFADQYSFSKFFKKNMGISPTEFRKRIVELHTI